MAPGAFRARGLNFGTDLMNPALRVLDPQAAQTLHAGSWVVINGVISPRIWVIATVSYSYLTCYNPTYNYP